MNNSDYNTKLVSGLLIICAIFYVAKIVFQKEHFGGMMGKGMFGKGDDKKKEEKKEGKKNTTTSETTTKQNNLCKYPNEVCECIAEDVETAITNYNNIRNGVTTEPSVTEQPGQSKLISLTPQKVEYSDSCKKIIEEKCKTYACNNLRQEIGLNVGTDSPIQYTNGVPENICELEDSLKEMGITKDLCTCIKNANMFQQDATQYNSSVFKEGTQCKTLLNNCNSQSCQFYKILTSFDYDKLNEEQQQVELEFSLFLDNTKNDICCSRAYSNANDAAGCANDENDQKNCKDNLGSCLPNCLMKGNFEEDNHDKMQLLTKLKPINDCKTSLITSLMNGTTIDPACSAYIDNTKSTVQEKIGSVATLVKQALINETKPLLIQNISNANCLNNNATEVNVINGQCCKEEVSCPRFLADEFGISFGGQSPSSRGVISDQCKNVPVSNLPYCSNLPTQQAATAIGTSTGSNNPTQPATGSNNPTQPATGSNNPTQPATST